MHVPGRLEARQGLRQDKFSWPLGATFEGEFKSGRMEGFGTFTGSDGDTYRGSWTSDRKHGYGQKRYVSGDYSMMIT
ncbi:hypothetical protein RJ640_004397 [Escallonia rubra]|uniref:Uncharacterized protein n=1 Tax=Escallonia rubra TaxID=112253 RepID=A0AA88QP75_9ASTE|nr:hypothetical protein RJ640_004397 [Escallonia rubra]